MLKASDLKGIIPALITPFDEREELSLEPLKKLVNHLIECGVHGVMTTGGNGEFPHLLPDERKRVLEVVVEEVNGRVPVIACTSACSVKEVVEYSKHALDVGADAVIITPPYYFKLPPHSIKEHYERVAESVDIPIVVYNNPEYTGNNIDPKLMREISEIDGVIGLKQSNYDISETIEIIRLVGDRISVLTGIDSQLYPTLCVGGKGIFSTAACIVPREMVKLYDEFINGRVEEAFKIHLKLQVLNRLLEYDPGYVAPCKEALNLMGFNCGPVRAPLPKLSEDELKELKHALRSLGLIG